MSDSTESDEFIIHDVSGVDALKPGTWVIDADETAFCLVDTHMGFPQRMWMRAPNGGRLGEFHNLERATFPIHLAEMDGDCEHKWGSNEMGHCFRCGQVVAEPRPMVFDEEGMRMFRAAAAMNARYEQSRKVEE